MRAPTLTVEQMLLQQAGMVPLEDVCKFFGLSPVEALKRASSQGLPVPVFKLGSQKSPWLVYAQDVVDYVKAKHKEATSEHRAVNAG
jgi:hypothetical protein